MSYRQFNSPQVASSHPAQRGIPKWVSVAFASHSLALRNEGPLTTGHCCSNRNTSKLKFAVTHTKQSTGQFLIATFRAFAATPVRSRPTPGGFPEARKLENSLSCFESAPSKFLIDNFHRDLSSTLSSRSILSPARIECGEDVPAFLIAELWKIRN